MQRPNLCLPEFSYIGCVGFQSWSEKHSKITCKTHILQTSNDTHVENQVHNIPVVTHYSAKSFFRDPPKFKAKKKTADIFSSNFLKPQVCTTLLCFSQLADSSVLPQPASRNQLTTDTLYHSIREKAPSECLFLSVLR